MTILLKSFKFYYKDTPFDKFIQNIKKYLEDNHSKIDFDFSIINKSSIEPNPTARQYLICDNLVEQFIAIELKNIPIPKPISQNQLWDKYTFNSRPNGLKLPEDWVKRKMLVLTRDNNTCQRCGIFIKIENAHGTEIVSRVSSAAVVQKTKSTESNVVEQALVLLMYLKKEKEKQGELDLGKMEEELKEIILKEVKTFRKGEPQNDDITIVILKAE